MDLSIDSCMGELIQAVLEKVYGGTPDKCIENKRQDSTMFCQLYHAVNIFFFPLISVLKFGGLFLFDVGFSNIRYLPR